MFVISDSIALKILNENTLITGVGNEIRLLTKAGSGYISPFRLKGKVHGIESGDSSNIILVYGEHEFVLIGYTSTNFELLHRGSLSDWISTGKVLQENGSFLLVTAHSVALLCKYDVGAKTCQIVEKSSCTDKSTLYCSYVHGDTWDGSLILGGNAFGEVLIWQPSVKCTENPDKSKLLHRIPGHNGVVFSIDIDIKAKLMITTSDDRSIRFWDITTAHGEDGGFDFEKSTFTPRKSGYSHVARVFKGKIIQENGETYALTGGEDSFVCLWNRDCELLFKRREQFGATIWNLEYDNPTKTLITAGSSGNVLTFNLQDCFKAKKASASALSSQALASTEYIAKLKFLDEKNLIGITNKNQLMHRNGIHDGDWVAIEGFVPYKCTILEVFEGHVAVAGYQQVTLYRFNCKTSSFQLVYNGALLPGVIRSFVFLSRTEFLISDDSGNCKLIKTPDFQDHITIDLPQCKERWITAASKVGEGFLVISNRLGSLMLYAISEVGSGFVLCDTIKRLHGNLGATTISRVNDQETYCLLKSSGHDGTIKTIKLDKVERTLRTLSREIVPIAWIERIYPCQDGNNELLFGFNDNHFVLWSREVDKHFEIPCGGGHRCWDLHLQLTANNVSIVFIKNKQVVVCQERVFNEPGMALQIVRNKWHVRPCNAMCFLPGSNGLYIASAGDDNLLKISQFHTKSASLTQLHEIHSHISSIRGLRAWSTGNGRHLIFSCGGRSQICVTSFDEKSNAYEELIDYSIQKETPSQDIRFDPETRVMSIDIRPVRNDSFELFAGCSDGYIRKFSLQKGSNLTLISEVFYGRCILHVRVAGDNLLSIATDGVICFWDFNISDVSFKVPHHESGVNSFDVRIVNGSEFHLLTGGDDQQVVYSKALRRANSFDVEVMQSMNYLHTAQVTAVKFAPGMECFYSSSVDQTVRRVDLESFTSNWEVLSCVADVKGIDVIQDRESSKLLAFLYGCGLQVYDLSSE